MATPTHTAQGQPDLSVIVPTHGRNELLNQLLRCCGSQTLSPDRFEVIVVDDGSPNPVAIDDHRRRFALTVLRQEQAGPGSARNLALEACRAELTLLLTDDGMPAPDLFERHLQAHASRREPSCIRGSFDFSARARQHPFGQVLEGTDLLSPTQDLTHGELHGWSAFSASNLSLPTEALVAAGGFDSATFREAACEDVELGYRLAQRGWQVLYLADLVCEHDHVIDSSAYFQRKLRLGVNVARMYAKHGDKEILRELQGAPVGEQFFFEIQSTCEAFYGPLLKFQEKFLSLESSHEKGTPLEPSLLQSLSVLTRRLSLVAFYRGVLMELGGKDPEDILVNGPPSGRLTSIIAVSHQNLDATRRCVEALRGAKDDNHPIEILFVDDGSTDGTAQYLSEQTDLTLIRGDESLGLAQAKNLALSKARGDWIVLLSSDVQVSPGWLSRLLYHAEVDAKSGCIGPVSDRANEGQQVFFPLSADPESIAAFDRDRALTERRKHVYSALLSPFCQLFRRQVIDVIGGFDERFAHSALEGDDFTLRASLAGFHNRIALDVFVHNATNDTAAAAQQARLDQSWGRFREKWGLPVDAAHGDEAALAQVMEHRWAREELHVPFESRLKQSAAALPHAAARLDVEKAGHWND